MRVVLIRFLLQEYHTVLGKEEVELVLLEK